MSRSQHVLSTDRRSGPPPLAALCGIGCHFLLLTAFQLLVMRRASIVLGEDYGAFAWLYAVASLALAFTLAVWGALRAAQGQRFGLWLLNGGQILAVALVAALLQPLAAGLMALLVAGQIALQPALRKVEGPALRKVEGPALSSSRVLEGPA